MTQAAVSPSPHVIVRNGQDADWPLLATAFVTTYSNRRSYYGVAVPPQVLSNKLMQLRESPDWKLLVACPSHMQSEIMGMLLYAPEAKRKAAAWIMVKYAWQRKGVAKALLKVADLEPPVEIDCAFLTNDAVQLAGKYGYTLRFRPYLPDIALWNTLQAISVEAGSK